MEEIDSDFHLPAVVFLLRRYPDRKAPGANMWPTWGRQDPGGPHVGHVILAIGDLWNSTLHQRQSTFSLFNVIALWSATHECHSGSIWHCACHHWYLQIWFVAVAQQYRYQLRFRIWLFFFTHINIVPTISTAWSTSFGRMWHNKDTPNQTHQP